MNPARQSRNQIGNGGVRCTLKVASCRLEALLQAHNRFAQAAQTLLLVLRSRPRPR
jgi:hypothetical protein